ncbi:uncharacterized protein [Aegilops tauschii subsp. strangulata]|uniref:uncharacterized protein n=1 Tax=Aegilops tauschii subsp. strangulata TaxID=200361 RepID=UPI003CC871CE
MALWQAMRETWELPTQDELRDAEPDWLFRLLEKLPDTQKMASLMIMWRIWQHPEADSVKGKQVLNISGYKPPAAHEIRPKPRWEPPDREYAKLNIDGAFVKADGTAGAGMILRDHEGAVIFAATRALFNCGDALEAEMAAMKEGLQLTLHWTNQSLLVETDCAELLQNKAMSICFNGGFLVGAYRAPAR